MANQEPLRFPPLSEAVASSRIGDMLKLFGPGAIIASVTIGSGETLFASRGGAIFGYGGFLWCFVLLLLMKGIQVYTAMQIDGLGHVTTGEDNHWYNGFKEADWGGNWGPRKAGAETIPPMVIRGILIDVAGFKNVEALPGHYTITVSEPSPSFIPLVCTSCTAMLMKPAKIREGGSSWWRS